MPHTRRSAAGSFVGYRLVTGDLDASATFYGRLFDWTTPRIREVAGRRTMVFRSGDHDVAAVMPTAGEASLWLPCLAVDELDDAVSTVRRAGGSSVIAPPAWAFDESLAAVTDPTGARFCLTAGSGPKAGEARADAAAPGRFCWNELLTREPDAAAAFYQELAGWTHLEWDLGQDGRYWLFRHGGQDVAGMMHDSDVSRASCWVPYVQVVSAEETAALAIELGGTLVIAPGDVPGRGRYAVIGDPGGALVAVFALTVAA